MNSDQTTINEARLRYAQLQERMSKPYPIGSTFELAGTVFTVAAYDPTKSYEVVCYYTNGLGVFTEQTFNLLRLLGVLKLDEGLI